MGFYFKDGDSAPATWLQKKGVDSPGLILTKGSGSMLYLGSELLASFKDGETAKAVVSFLASFYQLDFGLSVHMACFFIGPSKDYLRGQ